MHFWSPPCGTFKKWVRKSNFILHFINILTKYVLNLNYKPFSLFSGTSKLLSNGCCGCQERKTIESCSLTNETQRKKGNKQFEMRERICGQQWQWGENKRRKRKRRKVRTCVGILTCDSIVFPPSTTYRVIFNSPPCLVPKWKEKKQANRGKNRGSFIWRMSWKSSSGWLHLIFSFWYWTGRGGGIKNHPLCTYHEVSVLKKIV